MNPSIPPAKLLDHPEFQKAFHTFPKHEIPGTYTRTFTCLGWEITQTYHLTLIDLKEPHPKPEIRGMSLQRL